MIAALVGGVLVLGVFVVIERRVAAPMFRLDLFKIRAFTGGASRRSWRRCLAAA